MNAETIKRYIDFAAANGLEYMLIDEGWYAGAGGGGAVQPGVDVTRPAPRTRPARPSRLRQGSARSACGCG